MLREKTGCVSLRPGHSESQSTSSNLMIYSRLSPDQTEANDLGVVIDAGKTTGA